MGNISSFDSVCVLYVRLLDYFSAFLFSSLLTPKDSPPPNSYDVGQTFAQANGHSYLQPRSEGAVRRQSCFLSAAPRDTVFLPCDPGAPGIADNQTHTEQHYVQKLIYISVRLSVSLFVLLNIWELYSTALSQSCSPISSISAGL